MAAATALVRVSESGHFWLAHVHYLVSLTNELSGFS